MSLRLDHLGAVIDRFPRVSGDEPSTRLRASGSLRFSPRERG